MNFSQKSTKSISVFLAVLMLVISVPFQPLLAAMVDTETAINLDRIQNTRDYLKKVLSRNDVQKTLMEQGINPLEAKARVDSLSDSEVSQIADQIDQLPAAGGALEAIVVAAVLVFLALLLTDVLGYTDIFPFVKK